MSGQDLYFVDMLDIARDAGVKVGENSITAGWQQRSRSSGGFPSVPIGNWWHHTASKTKVENDLTWQIRTCPERPVGNCLLDRTGTVWPVAAGASNCAGRGGPTTFSRGECPRDGGNTRGFQIEAANNGIGEQWPVEQIDAYFAFSNAMNERFGNRPDDIVSHHGYAPTRKVDPAVASSVLGPWVPRRINSSGTWSLDDIRAECVRRAGSSSGPTPTPTPEDDMALVIKGSGGDSYYAWNGVTITGIPGLNWVQAGFDNGLYKNVDPVIYSQNELDELLEQQMER